MKNFLLGVAGIALFIGITANANAQGLRFGLHLGTSEYSGDLGNYFYDFRNPRVFGGVSIHQYLNKYFDLMGQVSYGELHVEERTSEENLFHAKFVNANLMTAFKFNNGYILPEKAIVQPFIMWGLGGVNFESDQTDEPKVSVNVPFGGGINLRVNRDVSVSLATTVNYPFDDTYDGFKSGNYSDFYLYHSLGVIFGLSRKVLDSDGDGIADKADKCPGTASGAKVNADGCPIDKDNDGIIDEYDQCPDAFGPKMLNGCPDRDGDGIADKDDECPDAAGSRMLKGCPDRDGDGVEDSKDKCPDVVGTVANSGCPATGTLSPGTPDDDNTLIYAERMRKDQATLDGIFRNIEFEFNKAVLKPSSTPALQQVKDIMERTTAYRLKIEGHTDNVGSRAYNKKLSHERAAAVRNWLLNNGVDASRVVSEGFGEDRPFVDNNTPADQQLNRRVELKLF